MHFFSFLFVLSFSFFSLDDKRGNNDDDNEMKKPVALIQVILTVVFLASFSFKKKGKTSVQNRPDKVNCLSFLSPHENCHTHVNFWYMLTISFIMHTIYYKFK